MKKSLNGQWNLKSKVLDKELRVNVPGSIYNDLYKNKIINEPYYRDNEKDIAKWMQYDYEYSCQFNITKEEISKVIELVFDGIDTISEIYINDTKVACTYNMHRKYSFTLNKDKLFIGLNNLKVIIKSCLEYINEKAKNCQQPLLQMGYAIKNYIHIRKAHCMFGWDWGPQMPDGGIWRDVYLNIYDSVKINTFNITQKIVEKTALVNIDLNLSLLKDLEIECIITNDNKEICKQVQKANINTSFIFEIINPKKWYPNGYGKQDLYQVKIRLIDKQATYEQEEKRIGLRKLVIDQTEDQYGSSFTITVNDQKIFLKGADYIIEDNILPRTNNDRTKFLLNSCMEANFNAIRVWGGAIYPNDYFYDLCDDLGLLVWQDLMFACAEYNIEAKDFQEEITQEVIYNIQRIKYHPCLALICGNNENEMAVIDWNMHVTSKQKENYLYQFETLLKDICYKTAPEVFYWPSSPSSKGSFDNPNDENRGDMHYWGVWHNNEPIENYRNHFPRLLSEYGMQSFPCMKTINSFASLNDQNIFSYVMERHQKNNDANSKIFNYIGKMFLFPKDFRSIIYLSQVIEAEAVRYCVEHLRRNYGRCMGSIYWQLNDCWPVASWSSIDYYNRYKALQYYAKHFYAPILLSIEENKENYSAKMVITNETNADIQSQLEYQLMDFNGSILKEGTTSYKCNKYSTKQLLIEKFDYSFDIYRHTFLYVKSNINGVTYENSCSFVKDKYLELQKPIYTKSLEVKDNNYVLTIKANTLVKYLSLETKEDIIFSDNFFNLYPNQERKISFKTNKAIKIDDIKLFSLIDTY